MSDNRGFHPVLDEPPGYLLIDGCVQVWRDADFASVHRHGVTAYAVTTPLPHEDLDASLEHLSYWHKVAREHAIGIARTPEDIEGAHAAGRAVFILAAQDAEVIGGRFHRLEAFYQLGLRMLIPAYNRSNLFAGGCLDRDERGLTSLGLELVSACNALGVTLDASHVSERASLEMMEASQTPVVFSHANARARVDNPRNITDEQARACAAQGGVIGLVPWGPLLLRDGQTKRPTVEDVADHADHFAQLLGGVEHLALGTDFSLGSYEMHVPDAWSRPRYRDVMGRYNQHFTTDPHSRLRFAEGFDTFPAAASFVSVLTGRGYADADIAKILGGNFLRVFKASWVPRA